MVIRTLFASHEFSITNTLSKRSKVFRQGGYQIGATRCWWLSDSWLKFPAENIFLDASSNIGTVQDFMSLKNSQQPLLTVWPDFTLWKVRGPSKYRINISIKLNQFQCIFIIQLIQLCHLWLWRGRIYGVMQGIVHVNLVHFWSHWDLKRHLNLFIFVVRKIRNSTWDLWILRSFFYF